MNEQVIIQELRKLTAAILAHCELSGEGVRQDVVTERFKNHLVFLNGHRVSENVI